MQRTYLAMFVLATAEAFHGNACADDHVTIEATADASADSNVAQSSPAVAAQRGLVQGDSVFSPGIGVDVSLPVGLQEVFLRGTASYSFHARNSQLDSQHIDLTGGLAAHLRNCKATFAGTADDERTDLAQLSAAVTRNVEQTETVGVSADCGGQVGLGPTFAATEQWSDNSAPQLLASDWRSASASAGLAYRRPGFGELSLVGTFVQTDFPNRDLIARGASLQDGYRDYSFEVRYDRRLGARLEGTLQVGYTTVSPFDRQVQGYNGIDFRADLSVRISPRLQAQFDAERGTTPTIVSNATYDLQSKFSVAADYTITPKLKLRLAGSETTDRYSGADFVNGLDIRRQTGWTITGSSRFQLSRRVGIELSVTHQVGSADINSYDFVDDRAGLSISVKI